MILYGYLTLGGFGSIKGVQRHFRSISGISKKYGVNNLPECFNPYTSGNKWDLSTPLIQYAEKMLDLPKMSFGYSFGNTTYKDYQKLSKVGIFSKEESFWTDFSQPKDASGKPVGEPPKEGVRRENAPGEGEPDTDFLIFQTYSSRVKSICCFNPKTVDTFINFDVIDAKNRVHKGYVLLLMGYAVALGQRMFIASSLSPGYSDIHVNEVSVWSNVFRSLKCHSAYKGTKTSIQGVTCPVYDISNSFINLYQKLLAEYSELRVNQPNSLISQVKGSLRLLKIADQTVKKA